MNNTLFSSLPSRNTGFFGTGSSTSANMLSDYFSIKNGSYSKLMKAYYSNNTSDEVSKIASNNDTSKTTTKANSALTSAKNAANELKSATDALNSSALYEKVTTTDNDGNTSTDYNRDAIYSAVSDFVTSYNKMLDAGEKSNSSAINANVSSMEGMTNVNSGMLGKIGISVSSSGKLSVDEDAFKKADMNDVISMFNSRGSYGYQIGAQASSASYSASYSLSTGYNSSGAYSYANSSTYFDSV